MILKDSLILLLSGSSLVGSVCRIGLKHREMVFFLRVPCIDTSPESLRAALRTLLEGIRSTGLNIPDDVRVCLSAATLLFRDWTFPFRSRAKMGQALALLLETEFPFDAATLVHRTGMIGKATGFRHGTQAISVSLRKEDLAGWLDIFEEEEIFPRLVTADPFPLLGSLPRQPGLSLLLHVGCEGSTVALCENGIVRRIRVLSAGWCPQTPLSGLDAASSDTEKTSMTDLAVRLYRESGLVLEGTSFLPDRLLGYGDVFLKKGASARFADVFEYPVFVPGQDIPLAGQMARLGETDSARQMAWCIADMPLPSRWRLPVYPSFHRAGRDGRCAGEQWKGLLMVVCGVVCVGVAGLVSVWAEGAANNSRAAQYEEITRALFRKTLPDVRGSFNVSQMESILKSRLAGLRGAPEDRPSFPVLRLLQAIHEAVPPTLDVRIDRLSLDARRCGLSGIAPGYDQVNAFRDTLAALQGVTEARILSATNRTGKPEPGLSGDSVLFEIELILEGERS